jgi:hypothetical protein
MIGVLRIKEGADISNPSPGGFRILSALDQVVAAWLKDATLTSGRDGEHSGPTDPHHNGSAYDVRSQDFNQVDKTQFLNDVMKILGFERFYGFLESPETPNEHFHFQVKKGTTYP